MQCYIMRQNLRIHTQFSIRKKLVPGAIFFEGTVQRTD